MDALANPFARILRQHHVSRTPRIVSPFEAVLGTSFFALHAASKLKLHISNAWRLLRFGSKPAQLVERSSRLNSCPARRSSFWHCLTAILVLIAMDQGAIAQSIPGILPFSTNEYGVDVATGNVNIAFPLRSKNGKIPFWSKVVGTSGMLDQGGQWQPMQWTYQDPSITSFSFNIKQSKQCNSGINTNPYYYADVVNDFTLVDSTGATHWFGGTWQVGTGTTMAMCGNQSGSIGPFQSTDKNGHNDGAGYTLIISNGTPTVYDRNGNFWSGGCDYGDGCWFYNTYYDPDRASISRPGSTAGGPGSGTPATDSLGTAVLNGLVSYNSGGAPSGGYLTSPSFSYLDENGNSQQYSLGYTTLNLASNFNCTNGMLDFGGPSHGTVQYPVLTSIQLPGTNSAKYSISYEPTPGMAGYYTGRVASITLPSGGTISYEYSGGNQGMNCYAQTVPTVTVIVNDNNGNTGTYTYASSLSTTSYLNGANFTVTKTDPVGNQTVFHFNGEYQTEVQNYQGTASGTPLKTVTTCYNGNLTNCVTPSTAVNLPITQKDVYTSFGSSSSSLVGTKYDSYGDVISEADMDYGNAGSNGQCLSATSGVCKLTTITYGSWNGSSCASLANIPAAPCDVKIANNNSGTTLAETRYTYNSAGHPTAVSRWVSASTWLTTNNVYNTNGTLASTTDPNNNKTQYGYAATGSGGCNGVLLTSITYPLASVGSSSQSWNCNGGVVVSSIDVNRNTTSYSYDDPFWRRTSASYPDGGSVQTTYNTGSSLPWTITTDTVMTSTTTNETSTQYDGFARAITRQLSTDPAGPDIVTTTYDLLGNVSALTNPHRSTPSATDGITYNYYDALGRQVAAKEPDGSYLLWCYNGIASTSSPAVQKCNSHLGAIGGAGMWVDSMDENKNDWQRSFDSLGRITEVMEPNGSAQTPSMETDYTYDVLSNLLSLEQWGGASGASGARSRSFSYDGLSRLIQAFNPESGWTCYGITGGTGANGSNCTSGYDANGNLLYKTDGRGKTISWSYDGLNRVTAKSASDGSLSYTYSYDNTSSGSFGIGKLFGEFSGSSSGNGYYYDSMGRVSGQSFQTPSLNGGWQQAFNAKYDLAGNLISLTYPDGRVINNTWNSAGQLIQITDNASGYHYLTSSSGYWPNGSPESIFHGNGVADGYNRNSRLQLNDIAHVRIGTSAPGTYVNQTTLFNVEYCFGPATSALSSTIPGCPSLNSINNGNLREAYDILNSNNSQTFSYDALNRLTSFANGSGSMTQTYAIDPFGNMTQAGNYTFSTSFGTNNQITGSGVGYDAAGNLTSFNNGVANTYIYDAENKLLNVNNGAVVYTYDPNGDRVRKDAGGTWTEYVRFNGQTLAEKNADGTWSDYIFANGQLLSRADAYDIRIHMHGTNCSNCGSNPNMFAGITSLTAANGYTIRAGDMLTWRQYQSGSASGGLYLYFTDNTDGLAIKDTDGQLIDQDLTMNQWHVRMVDLSSYAGKTVELIDPFDWKSAPAGNWDIYYGDITLVSADGTSIPIYSRAMMTLSTSVSSGVSNFTAVTEKVTDTTPLTTITHFHGDQIGSTRIVTAATGWPVANYTYFPYGQGPQTGTNHLLFTGKERDSESGDDYFGARYFGSSMGRFLSPDPSNLSVDWWLPQTWNRYSYGLNNPLAMIDKNGLWPVWTHNNIIDEAFPGMSKTDLQNLKDSSYVMDAGAGQQLPSNSYMHGMSDGGGTVFWGGEGGNAAHDRIAADNYIDSQVEAAQEAQANWIAQGHSGFSPLALSAFGNALHTTEDRLSPAHAGEQPWANKPWWHYTTINHFFTEAWRTRSDVTATDDAARSLFRRTFGNEFDWVFFQNPCARTSATDSQRNSTGWSGCQ